LPINPVSIRPAAAARSGMSRAGQPATRLRLTRRGRLVVTALIVAGVTVVALLITMLASGGAQATNSGQARAGYQGLHEIVVQPGQTLWSIASTADPSADPRTVIQEIMTANTLTGATVVAGQILWVPR
jgi:LysM domain